MIRNSGHKKNIQFTHKAPLRNWYLRQAKAEGRQFQMGDPKTGKSLRNSKNWKGGVAEPGLDFFIYAIENHWFDRYQTEMCHDQIMFLKNPSGTGRIIKEQTGV